MFPAASSYYTNPKLIPCYFNRKISIWTLFCATKSAGRRVGAACRRLEGAGGLVAGGRNGMVYADLGSEKGRIYFVECLEVWK